MKDRITPYIWPVFFALALFGFIDATYLTIEHVRGVVPACTIGGCDLVLTSEYAEVAGVPVSLMGVFFYLTLIVLGGLHAYRLALQPFLRKALLVVAGMGFLTSLFLVYLQLFVIEAICVYCMFSALSSTSLFILTLLIYTTHKSTSPSERKTDV